MLFFDTRLSASGEVSCATCHDPKLAFSESAPTSKDINGASVARNSQSLINSSLMDVLTWSNPVLRKLENQIIVPLFLDTPGEMGLSHVWPKVRVEVLASEPYLSLFRSSFPSDKEPDTRHLFQALGAYVRSLVALDSAYDRYLEGDRFALSENALLGRELFFSKRTNCGACHSGVLLSSASAPAYLNSQDPLALPAAVDESGRVIQFAHNGLYNWDDAGGMPEKHEGLYEFTLVPEDRGKFRIPPLRNVARTAPYMHDGSLATLMDVIEHYDRGGTHRCKKVTRCQPAPQKHDFIRPLGLNATEKSALIEFLNSLSTESL